MMVSSSYSGWFRPGSSGAPGKSGINDCPRAVPSACGHTNPSVDSTIAWKAGDEWAVEMPIVGVPRTAGKAKGAP